MKTLTYKARHFTEKALVTLFCAFLITACAPPPGPAGAAGPQGPMDAKGFLMSTIWFIMTLFLVYYVLVLQPAQSKKETQKKFLDALKKNDEVVTSGGIFGRVVLVKPEYLSLEIASNVKIKVEPEHVHPVKQTESADSSEDKNTTTKK